MENLSCGRWFRKIIRERQRIPTTHSETGIHCKESGESHGDKEEFPPEESEDDAEARKDFRSIQGYFIYCHHIEPRVQLKCREKNHSLFQRLILLNETPPRRNIRCWERFGDKPKHVRKTNLMVLILEGRTEFCTLLQFCARIRSFEKVTRMLFT